jgi:hypothetical protein
MDLILHNGKIREKLSYHGYYISQLGLIKKDENSSDVIGDLRYTYGIKRLFLLKKEEVVVSKKRVEGKSGLIRSLKCEKIPFREAKF